MEEKKISLEDIKKVIKHDIVDKVKESVVYQAKTQIYEKAWHDACEGTEFSVYDYLKYNYNFSLGIRAHPVSRLFRNNFFIKSKAQKKIIALNKIHYKALLKASQMELDLIFKDYSLKFLNYMRNTAIDVSVMYFNKMEEDIKKKAEGDFYRLVKEHGTHEATRIKFLDVQIKKFEFSYAEVAEYVAETVASSIYEDKKCVKVSVNKERTRMFYLKHLECRALDKLDYLIEEFFNVLYNENGYLFKWD